MADRSVVPAGSNENEAVDAAVPVDDVHDILAIEHRRHALAFLDDQRGRVSVDALADHVTTAMAGQDGRDITHAEVATRLYHVDLPKLADAGIVVYDRDAGTVTPTDRLDAVAGPATDGN